MTISRLPILPTIPTLLGAVLLATSVQAQQPPPRAHTYSIVARDSATGMIGVAVQSHWFSVGGSVAWAEPGVGAVATQSFILPAYGPRGLALMRAGLDAPAALRALLSADPDSQVRQVAMIDARGRVLTHTGSRSMAEAGGRAGPNWAAQANIMLRNTVWDAMGRAFETARGDLAERLLAALDAAQREGGDLRGRQSAALIVVSGDPTLPPWQRVFDLRVEDSPDPLSELRRLLHLARAYQLATKGDDFMTVGNVDSALVAYAAADAMVPDSAVNGELAYWHAVTLIDRGRVAEAIPLLRRALRQDTLWGTLTYRLPRSGLLRLDSAAIAGILRQAR